MDNDDSKRYKQLIPEFQDKKGNIYFKGRDTEHKGAYKAKLHWINQSN